MVHDRDGIGDDDLKRQGGRVHPRSDIFGTRISQDHSGYSLQGPTGADSKNCAIEPRNDLSCYQLWPVQDPRSNNLRGRCASEDECECRTGGPCGASPCRGCRRGLTYSGGLRVAARTCFLRPTTSMLPRKNAEECAKTCRSRAEEVADERKTTTIVRPGRQLTTSDENVLSESPLGPQKPVHFGPSQWYFRSLRSRLRWALPLRARLSIAGTVPFASLLVSAPFSEILMNSRPSHLSPLLKFVVALGPPRPGKLNQLNPLMLARL